MSDLMVHALDIVELARVHTRHPPQRTDIFLAFCPSFDNVDAAFDDVVYTLRVNQAFATSDMIYEVDYDRDGLGAGVAADFANCLDDMTVFVGTSEGAYDVGVVRLRGFTGGSDEDSGTMLLGEMSEVDWEDNLYLTVIDDFNLWPRHVYIDGVGDIFMDRDVAYTDQHQYPDPVPVLGPDAVVYDVDNPINAGNTVDVLFDASDSWALDGGALTYSWSAPGASATAGMGTATPTVTYNAPGRYTVSCAVTRDYGGGHVKAFTGYRRVYVFDVDHPPTVKFELGSDPTGQWDMGGWNFSVRMWDGAKLSEVVDRAKVILFAVDWFGNDGTSTGPIESPTHGVLRANILTVGWISGESIVFDNEKGWVDFQVEGPYTWFDIMPGFPHGLEDCVGNPTDWFEFQDLTIDKGLWSFLHWRTTATRMMDVYLTGDDRQVKEFADPVDSLWQQMTRAAEDSILAHPCCDRYGRLFVEIPVSLLPVADRAGVVTVMDMDRQDWREQVDIERRIVDDRAMLDMSGVGYLNGAADAFFSLAFGHIFGRYGDVSKKERLALHHGDQAANNELAGLLMGMANNEYPNVDLLFAGNYRVFDICPRQCVRCSIVEYDTERGIIWTNKKLLPHSVTLSHSDGVLMVDVSCAAETFPVLAVTGDAPVEPPPPPPPPSPPPPPTPPAPPDVLEEPDIVFVRRGTTHIYRTENWTDAPPTWVDITGTLSGTTIHRIIVDQLHRFIYAHGYGAGLYRASVDTASPAWTQILDYTSPPASLYGYRAGLNITLDGYVAVAAEETRVCCSGWAGYNGGRPALVVVAPDGSNSVLLGDHACPVGWCCPHHANMDWFGYYNYYSLGVAGSRYTLSVACADGSTRDYPHAALALRGDAVCTYTNPGRPGMGMWGWDHFKSHVDLGGLLIGSYSDFTGEFLLCHTIDTGDWVDVTDPAWAGGADDGGADRDAGVEYAVIVDADNLYHLDPGGSSVLQARAGLAGGPGAFAHCSCYYNDPDQLFLAVSTGGGVGFVLWTTDGCASWSTKEGALGDLDYQEIRPVWTVAP